MNLRSGVKIYDNDWFIKHRLSLDEAADLLASWNVTYVIAQSRLLPMQDSAVQSAVTALDAARYATLDDVAFRNALGQRGIAYFACLNIGFDPGFAAAHPELLPVDQHGTTMGQNDWYIGLSPDCAANLDHKTALLGRAVAALRPDVVHLGFIRWPGSGKPGCPATSATASLTIATRPKR